LLEEDHDDIELIGSGASSTVLRVTSDHQTIALKATQDIGAYKREAVALQNLSHPNVVTLVGLTTINRHYCLCLEFLPHHITLGDYVRNFLSEENWRENNFRKILSEENWRENYYFLKFTENHDFRRFLTKENEIWNIFSQLVNAVSYIHRCDFCHHDLNSRNILIDKVTGRVKIIDFGFSVPIPKLGGGLVDHNFGTPLYLPLEVLEGRRHDPRAVDVWSLGVILAEMKLQSHPWHKAKSLSELAAMIAESPLTDLQTLSYPTRQLVGLMLTVEPEKRVTIYQVEEMLKLYGGGM